MDNLKERILSGLFWSLSERFGVRLAQFLPTVILARLLSPEQFGLIAMLSIFIALAGVFVDSGFGTALIQKKNATYTDECSVFYFNIFIGVLAFILLFFTAPLVASFYAQPILTPLLRCLSLDFVIKSLGVVQFTLLTRALDFKTQLRANLAATVCSGIIGVAAAYCGLGVWSLVAQTLANTALSTATAWFLAPWRPSFLFKIESLKSMFPFGSRMLLSSLMGTLFDNIYQVFIGRFFSAASLGFYMRASSLQAIGIECTSSALGRVLFPALARIQDDSSRLRHVYRKCILLTTFVHFPLMIALLMAAGPLITCLFSAKWQPSVPYFQLLCGAGMLYPLQLINLDMLKVKGRSDLFFQLAFIKRALMIAAMLVAYPWGISAMLIGHIINTVVGYVLNSWYSGSMVGYPMREQIRDLLPTASCSVVMAGAMWSVGRLVGGNDWVVLLTQLGIGAVAYLLLSVFAKTEPVREMLAVAKRFVGLKPGS